MKLNPMILVLALLALTGCGDPGWNESPGGTVSVTGAGATFPAPLYQKWAARYSEMHPSVRINYQAIGSGGGIKQITERTVDFGATDGPMTEAQLKNAPNGIMHIPMSLGAVVPIYNLPQVSKPLVFDGPLLADMFLGKVTKWNDAALAALNPGVELPDMPITVVHRSDGSGTTFIFTDYLAKVSAPWKGGPGVATTINWPVGRGARGNDGVAADVKQHEGSFGYVELIYAANNKIAYGGVVNAAGRTIAASTRSVSAAAAATLTDIPADLRISITNAPAEDAYPISGLTWILIYKEQENEAKGRAVVDFLWWAAHEGQAMSESLHYAPLPKELLPLIEEKLRSVTAGGKALLSKK